MAEPKLDVQELLKTWERLGPLTADPAAYTTELGEEVSDFVFRLASALPEIARLLQQHDDVMRAWFFLSQEGYQLTAALKEGQAHDNDEIARAYIWMARKLGRKPPRECD
jgi:hypothetical protein